ncbi:hypothetical protein B0H16DRAFT_146560 [Mycena metata]|uniref:Uncharacterized protein n=1 Tax=Mycena metata TaxID=1033252 RepID=A0AAD7JWF9_9AGAR|nr:hypothetical protein B0H16DRAFT_146560 [Mycena metata]
MIISWMVYASSYMLILGHQLGPDPPRGICGLQMLFIYACHTCCAVNRIYWIGVCRRCLKPGLSQNNGGSFHQQADHKYTLMLLAVPWALFVVITAKALIVVGDFAGIQRDPNYMYCHSVVDTQTRVSAFLCVFGSGAALCLEIWTAVILYRNWTSTGLGIRLRIIH